MPLFALIASALLAAAPAPDAAPAKDKATTKEKAPAKARKARSGRDPATKAPARDKAGKEKPGKAGKTRGAIADLQPGAAQPLPLRPAAARPLDTTGTVRSVIRQKAYLDAGTREGLAAGQVIQLYRRGEAAGQCTVEQVSERNAICAGPGVRAGDTALVNPQAAGSLPAVLPARPAPEEQARRLAAVERVPTALVDFKSTRVVEIQDRLRRTDVGFATFGYYSSDAGGLYQEQVYAAARSVEVFRGARLDLDLTAVARTPLPDTERFQPGKVAVVYIREASLSWAEPASPYRLSAGRVLPWIVPGGPTFDGAQAGWRPRPGTEVGLFGGGVPDAVTTAPGLDRATLGGYWSVEGLWGTSVFRNQGRLAWVRLPGSKSRVEVETSGQAWVARRLGVSLQARLGTGDYASPGKLDSGRADLSWTSPGLVSAYASYHYQESRVPDVAAPALYPGRTREVAGAVSYDRLGWLLIRATASHFIDISTHQDRTWLGPELSAPRLLGKWGGLSVGYSEELGTWAGRSAWLQGDLALGASTRLLARGSWLMDARPAPLSADHSAGLTLSAVSDVRPWLRFRLSAMGRYGIPISGSAPESWGGTVMGAVEGRY